MGLETLAIAALTLSVGSKVVSGFAAKQASEEEADRIRDQGALALAENEVEAERVGKERKKFLARQKLAFLKGGVTLEGSPLLILEEGEEETEKEVEAIFRRGFAQKSLAEQKAASTEATGRGRLFGSLSSALSTAASGIVIGRKIGFF